jgi:signal transduction histidine kinase/ActR/RegA family two-component response regulator/HPt (histidine-containing phosphotransfer) domain-containing protein
MNIRRKISIPMISLAIGGCLTVFIPSVLSFGGELNNAMRDKIDFASSVVEHRIEETLQEGETIYTQAFAQGLKELTGCEISIFLGDECVSTTLKNENGEYVIGERVASERVRDRVLLEGGSYTGTVNPFGNEMLGKYTPIYGENDSVTGMYFVGYYTAADVNKNIVFILNGVLITLGVLIACFIITRFISGIFERQIKRMMDDIRESRDAAETANNAKSSFLANMSHEIRTPMNAILGVTDILMQSEQVPAEFEEGLSKIYTSCNMLLGIINDILDFSKIEAGKMKIATAEYNIASLVSDAVQLNMMRTESKPVEFELLASENLPANLIGDELRIKQILNNLLSNAFKYTDSGRVTLTINFEIGEIENIITLLISVRDTGTGMTEEQLERLFAEYARFSKENSAVEGTGLGLAITHRLLNLMDGDISVVSEPGKGSLFSVRLPQRKANNRILGKETASNLRNFRFNHRIHNKYDRIIRNPMPYGSVLIVDDVENNLFVGVGLMKPYKLHIDTALSGREAINKVNNGNKYDIIFMDHMMPGMSGIEAVEHLRVSGYSGTVIALTANAVAGAQEMFLQSGFDDFISKPIDLRQLDLILNKYVRDKQPAEVLLAVSEEHKNGDGKQNGNSLPFAGEIDGLDIGKGLKRYNDDVKIYLQVLRSFASSVLPMLEAIKAFEAGGFESIDLPEYKIKTHGIKGASFNIYAEQVGKEAEKLEKAASKGDISYIKNNNAKFLETAGKLASDINNLLSTAAKDTKPGEEKPEKEKPESKTLSQLFSACLNYDVDGVDAAMAEIEKYRYKSDADNELLHWLRENVNMMKFKQISERLEERGTE